MDEMCTILFGEDADAGGYRAGERGWRKREIASWVVRIGCVMFMSRVA